MDSPRRRRSKVDDLPAPLREELHRLIREGFTLDEMLAHLRNLTEGPVPSRSSLGRYAKNFEVLAERVRRSQEIADRMVAEVGPQIADGKGFQVLTHGFQSLVFDFMSALPEGETLDPKNLSFLAGAIKDITSARKADTDLALKIRQEAAKQAAAKVDEVGKARGLTAETIKQMREAVLGTAA